MAYCNSAKACPWNSYLIAGFVVESSKAAVLLSESVIDVCVLRRQPNRLVIRSILAERGREREICMT
jgi:hypothetical protein